MPLVFHNRSNPITPFEHAVVEQWNSSNAEAEWLHKAKSSLEEAADNITLAIKLTANMNDDRRLTTAEDCLQFISTLMLLCAHILPHSSAVIGIISLIQRVRASIISNEYQLIMPITLSAWNIRFVDISTDVHNQLRMTCQFRDKAITAARDIFPHIQHGMRIQTSFRNHR